LKATISESACHLILAKPKYGSALDKIGPYTLVSKLGQGAFVVVWLAQKQTAIATTQFALKLPRDEDIDVGGVQAGSGHLDTGERPSERAAAD
jgi:hypothetical protein